MADPVSKLAFRTAMYVPLLLCAGDVRGQCSFDASYFQLPPCPFSYPPGIFPQRVTEDGALCGYYLDCEDVSAFHAFWWDGTSLHLIPLPANRPNGIAYDMNANGEIAGSNWIPTNTRRYAFVYSNGVVMDLGTFSDKGNTEAFAINDSGVAVGSSLDTEGRVRAFRWEGGVLSPLQMSLGPHSVAFDINEAGQIVGFMGSFSLAKAFRWDNGVVTQLDFGPLTSVAYSINNHGDSVGFIHTPTPQGNFNRAVMWKADGTVVQLGEIPGYPHCRAWDINDEGTIVGWCYISPPPPPPTPPEVGFLWRNGVMTALPDITPPPFRSRPFGINNNGQIAAIGGVNGPVAAVLTPIPGYPGDYDCNKIVNIDDLMGVINHWGPSGGASSADFDDNGTVDMDDLLAVINNWGPVGPVKLR